MMMMIRMIDPARETIRVQTIGFIIHHAAQSQYVSVGHAPRTSPTVACHFRKLGALGQAAANPPFHSPPETHPRIRVVVGGTNAILHFHFHFIFISIMGRRCAVEIVLPA
jgi:hypothetical protein